MDGEILEFLLRFYRMIYLHVFIRQTESIVNLKKTFKDSSFWWTF